MALSHIYDKYGTRHDYCAALFVLPVGTRIKSLYVVDQDEPFFYIEDDLAPELLHFVEIGPYALPGIDAWQILAKHMINLTHVGFARAFGKMSNAAIEIFGALKIQLEAERLEKGSMQQVIDEICLDVNGKLIQLQHSVYLAWPGESSAGVVVGFRDRMPVVKWRGGVTEALPSKMLEVSDGKNL